jgi:hypothetical protein
MWWTEVSPRIWRQRNKTKSTKQRERWLGSLSRYTLPMIVRDGCSEASQSSIAHGEGWEVTAALLILEKP